MFALENGWLEDVCLSFFGFRPIFRGKLAMFVSGRVALFDISKSNFFTLDAGIVLTHDWKGAPKCHSSPEKKIGQHNPPKKKHQKSPKHQGFGVFLLRSWTPNPCFILCDIGELPPTWSTTPGGRPQLIRDAVSGVSWCFAKFQQPRLEKGCGTWR